TATIVERGDGKRLVPRVELRILPHDFLSSERALIARESFPCGEGEKGDDGHRGPEGNQFGLPLPPFLSTRADLALGAGRAKQDPRGDEQSGVDQIEGAT